LTEDRRIFPRFVVQIPVVLTSPDTSLKVHGKTRDVSAGGIFFFAQAPLNEQQEIDFVMTLPPELTLTPLEVACRARVLRLETDASGKLGVAAAIQRFEFLSHSELIDNATDFQVRAR